MNKVKPDLIKHLSVLYDVCSMYCVDCKRWRYHEYSETQDVESDIITIFKQASCIKCDNVNYDDVEVIMRNRTKVSGGKNCEKSKR